MFEYSAVERKSQQLLILSIVELVGCFLFFFFFFFGNLVFANHNSTLRFWKDFLNTVIERRG